MGNVCICTVLQRMLLKTINRMTKIVNKQFIVDNQNLWGTF